MRLEMASHTSATPAPRRNPRDGIPPRLTAIVRSLPCGSSYNDGPPVLMGRNVPNVYLQAVNHNERITARGFSQNVEARLPTEHICPSGEVKCRREEQEDRDRRSAGSLRPAHRVSFDRLRVFLRRFLLSESDQRHYRYHRFLRREAGVPAVRPKELRRSE